MNPTEDPPFISSLIHLCSAPDVDISNRHIEGSVMFIDWDDRSQT